MRSKWFIAGCWLLLLCGQAHALVLDTPLADAAQEARARALFHQLRCVVCQSESIADSPADVASDMRRLVRERIKAGDSDDTVRGYIVERYGNAILMTPPLMRASFLLWFGPVIILSLAGFLAACYFRSNTRKTPP